MIAIDSNNNFTYKIPEMTRKIDKESDFIKTGYGHCMKPSELVEIIRNINSSDKKYCIYPNTFEVGRWANKFGNNIRIIDPTAFKDYNVDFDNTLFARITSLAQQINEEISDTAIFSFITDDVSDFDKLTKCIHYMFNYEANKCNISNSYFIIENLIPFKIEDYEMCSYTLADTDYLSNLYTLFLTEVTEEDYNSASTHFYEFGKIMKLPDGLIKKVWNIYLHDVDFNPIRVNEDIMTCRKILTNTPVKLNSSDMNIIKKISKNTILNLMKDFCGFIGNICTDLSSEDAMSLISQNINLGTIENDDEDIFIIGEVENGKQYILFKTDKAKSYVFGYDFKEADKLLMIKLNYKKDDFKFIER